jgi:poly(3-hydroxybutyrate) depolymerase
VQNRGDIVGGAGFAGFDGPDDASTFVEDPLQFVAVNGRHPVRAVPRPGKNVVEDVDQAREDRAVEVDDGVGQVATVEQLPC